LANRYLDLKISEERVAKKQISTGKRKERRKEGRKEGEGRNGWVQYAKDKEPMARE
jgi:hypothetical protein